MPGLSKTDIQEAWINSHTIELPHIPGMVSSMQKFEAPFIVGYEFKVENPGELNTYFIQLQIKGDLHKHYWIMPEHKMIGLHDVGLAINSFWNLNVQMNQMGWLGLGSSKSEPETEFKGNPFEGDEMFQEAVYNPKAAEEQYMNKINPPIQAGDQVVITTDALKLKWGDLTQKVTSMIGKVFEVLMVQDGPTPQADLWIENHHWMIPVTMLHKINPETYKEPEPEPEMKNPFAGDEMFQEAAWDDDSEEDFEYKHEHSGMEIGDIVQVMQKAKEYEGGWNTSWVPQMDDWVGGQFEIVGDEADAGWTLRDPKSGQMWAFPDFVLKVIKKVDKKVKKKKEMQYLKGHKASGIQPGDTVLVTTEAQSYERGWGYDWNEAMDELVGEEFEVMEDDGVFGFVIETEDGMQFHLPYFILQKEGSGVAVENPFEGDEMFKEAVPPKVPQEYRRDPVRADIAQQDLERKKAQMGEPRPEEDETIVPDEFMFESKMVFISNLTEIPEALADRVLAIQLNYDKEQALQLVDKKLQTLVPEYPELTMEDKKEILAFLRKYKKEAKHISLRTFVHVASIWVSNDPEKEKWALVQLASQV